MDRCFGVVAMLAVLPWVHAGPAAELPLESIPGLRMKLTGPAGDRVQANIDRWLLEAPIANPGMLEMFRVRDREPVPQVVPWAGEFVGKYLISAIQALRMTDDARLEPFVRQLIEDLLTCQADDGYLGPFRQQDRLLGQWDLWGHYHIMHALLAWHERTGDERALSACRKIGDLVCHTYLSGSRRVIDAGSPEMNMAIITSLGWLYRVTREERYRSMMKEILTDFERAGDYFRAGQAGIPFYRTPRPRWESLHCVQGLVELHRITADHQYRDAFLRTWESILQWDERNTGGFSSGEQATGNPFEDTPIETCCTIAWTALSVDALRLRPSSVTVDALERSFWNGVLGSQHPSGRWWTYNTPMNGVREASAHTIVFQSRAGTPELNCCSVNAPRGLGMVSEWGVMRRGRDIALHYLGPMSASVPLEDGSSLDILTTTSYPFNGKVDLLFQNHSSQEVTVHVHRPGWAPSPRMTGPWQESSAHDDVTLRCPAKGKVQASLDFDMPLHYRIGDMEQIQRVAIYRGPILLAYDQTLNLFDDRKIPVIDLRRLAEARVVTGDRPTSHPWRPAPWLVVDLPALDGSVRVADFASVGAVGTTYRSWLPASPIPPPLPVLLEPTGQAPLPPGPLVLLWRRPGGDASLRYHVRVRPAENPSAAPVVDVADLVGPRVVLSADQTRGMEPGKAYRLELATTNDSGQERLAPSVPIEIDASLPPLSPDQWTEFGERADGCLIEASLATPGPPGFGLLDAEEGLSFTSPDDPFAGSVHIAGGKSRLIYRLRRFPDDYTLGVWVKLHQMPVGLGQIASAWCQGGDDPLRLCLDRGQLHARVEGMGGASTTGVPIDLHTWHHLAIRKEGAVLCLFVDGTESARTHAPKRLMSRSQAIALGRNPRYGGDESIDASFARLRFDVRPLSDDELKKMARATSNDPR